MNLFTIEVPRVRQIFNYDMSGAACGEQFTSEAVTFGGLPAVTAHRYIEMFPGVKIVGSQQVEHDVRGSSGARHHSDRKNSVSAKPSGAKKSDVGAPDYSDVINSMMKKEAQS